MEYDLCFQNSEGIELNGEPLFTESCSQTIKGHAIKSVGGKPKPYKIQSFLIQQVVSSVTCCHRALGQMASAWPEMVWMNAYNTVLHRSRQDFSEMYPPTHLMQELWL